VNVARQLYESTADRTAEAEIGALITERWALSQLVKLSMAYGLDYAMVRGERDVVGFAEIKDRTLPFAFGDGYYISLQKALKAEQLSTLTGLQCVLVVRFSDRLIRRAFFARHQRDRLIIAGRTDRGDPLDIEPHVIIPWDAFKGLAA
jgi:hypothetical protein